MDSRNVHWELSLLHSPGETIVLVTIFVKPDGIRMVLGDVTIMRHGPCLVLLLRHVSLLLTPIVFRTNHLSLSVNKIAHDFMYPIN